MPVFGSRRPPAPTCEDCWDEDTQGSFLDGRAPANVAVKRSKSSDLDSKSVADKKSHDGSDSGYSSTKTGASDTMSTASLKNHIDLKVDNAPVERERQPYVYAPPRAEGSSSPTKTKTAKTEKTTKQTQNRFQHPRGICWVCDEYGYHFDITPEISRPATVAPEKSRDINRSPAPKTKPKDDSSIRPSASRRSSSSTKREGRPTSMYMAPGYGYPPMPMDYSHPMLAAHGWQTPPNQLPQYPHYQYQHAPPTPVSATYSQPPSFFDMSPMQFNHPPEPFYQDPSFKGHDENSRQFLKAKKQEGDSSRAASREPRPRSSTQKTRQSAEADKLSMPPPPKPEASRPVMRKTATEYPTFTQRRRSVFVDDDEAQEIQAIMLKERNSSQSRPPSSFKPPANATIQARPRTRKSVSYSDPSGTIQVASSTQREMPRRRTDPLEQKLASAEGYVAKINKQREAEVEKLIAKSRKQQQQREAASEEYIPLSQSRRGSEAEEYMPQARLRKELESEQIQIPKSIRGGEDDDFIPRNNRHSVNPSLTTEALKRFELKHSSAMSDAGSTRSKHSSSRESAVGRNRASTLITSNPCTNITMDNGISVSIPADYGDQPLDIMLGKIRLSMNPGRDFDRPPREMKRIERAPSETSQTSRRSLTSGSGVSVPKGREDQQIATRSKQNGTSSKRSSRAASSARADNTRGETRSIDYSLLDESYYFDYNQ